MIHPVLAVGFSTHCLCGPWVLCGCLGRLFLGGKSMQYAIVLAALSLVLALLPMSAALRSRLTLTD